MIICLFLRLVAGTSSSSTKSVEQNLNFDDSDDKTHLSVLLVTGFWPGHLYPITALGEELVKRGHNVSLCATVMEGSNLLPDLPQSYGINFISAGSDNLTQTDYDNTVKTGFQNASFSDIWKFFAKAKWPVVKVRSKIDEIGVDQFDVIISDGSICPVALYYSKLGKRTIVLLPLFVYMESSQGDTSATLSCSEGDYCFLGRLTEVILNCLLKYFQWYAFSGIGDIDEVYGRVMQEVYSASYFNIGIRIPLLITSTVGFEYPKTRYPMTHYVGPLMMDTFSPLEEELTDWLDKKKNKSVIYVGFGATGFITAHMASMIINGILATDFSAVWALPMSDQAVLNDVKIDKERFFISKWIPRQTLFKQPKLAMTILHCGMNGVQESLYNSLPVMCVPHSFDHFEIANRIEHAKVGIPLYSMIDSIRRGNVFSSENITSAIKTIANDKEYSERAQKMRQLYMFAGGAKRAADLVEFYTAVGYDHLVPAYIKYEWNWVQYYNLDVYCLLALLGFLIVYVFYKSLKCCCKCLCSKLQSKADKTKTE